MDTSQAAVFKAVDRLVELGAVPDVQHEDTGQRDYYAIITGVLTLRPSVVRFALVMEQQLQAHDQQSWRAERATALVVNMWKETQELEDAIQANRGRADDALVQAVWSEAADVANLAMMAAEVGTGAVYPDN